MSRFETLLRVALLVPMVSASLDAPQPDEVLSLMQVRAEKIKLQDSQLPTMAAPSVPASWPSVADTLGTPGLSPAAPALVIDAMPTVAGSLATTPTAVSSPVALPAELALPAATPALPSYTAALPAELVPLAQTLSYPATLPTESAPLAATPTVLSYQATLPASSSSFVMPKAIPQPAGWGPEAKMPEAVQPAGWGGLGRGHAELAAQRVPTLVGQEALFAGAAAFAAPASAINVQPADAVSFFKSPVSAQVVGGLPMPANERPAGWGPGAQKAAAV